MKRLFVRILLLSLLQYAMMADEASPDKIEDCPANKVCAIFVSDTCKVNGVRPDAIALAGYIWENATSCDKQIYKDHYARLDIQPSSLRNWSFVLTHWDDDHTHYRMKPDGSYDEQHIWNIGFDFGNAKITFIAANMVQFAWRKSGESEWHNSLHELTFIRRFQVVDGKFKFMQYSFNIESNEKLSIFFGKKQFSLMRMEANETVTLNDPRFLELLEQRATCDPLNSVCHGGCDELLVAGSSSAASCASDSSFWIHNNNEAMLTRHWKAARELKCKMNSWEAAWKEGAQELDSSWEVQCSKEQPAKLTNLAIGSAAFAGVLLAIALGVIVFCVLRCRRKISKESKSHSDAPTFSTKSTPGLYMSPNKRTTPSPTPSPTRPSPSPTKPSPSPIRATGFP